MPDRLDELAAQLKASQSQGGQAQSAPNEEENVWLRKDPPEEQSGVVPQLQRVFDDSTKSTPYSADKGIGGNALNAVENLGGGLMSLATPLVHPLKFAESFVPKTGTEKAVSMLGPGAVPMLHAGEGLVHALKKNPDETFGQYAGRVGGQATTAAGAVVGGAGVGEAGKAVADFTDPLKEYRSPLIPPDEATARAATDVLKPNPMDYRSTVSTLKDNLPYIKAQIPGGKFKNPVEFAKAAGNAGKEHSDFFRDQLIEPNRSHGEIGPSYDELQTINDKLRPIYKARSMGEQMTKESQDNMAALEARRDSLNDYLYRELSGRSGLPEDQIRAINQRGGSLQHVGDVTDSAQAMRRAGFSGYSPNGLPIPMGGFDRAMRLVKALRGGPEASAGRQLTRIAKSVDAQPEALPDADAVGAYRKMSDVDELSHVRQGIARADENTALSAARKPESMGPTSYPPNLVAKNPDPVLFDRSMRATGRASTISARDTAGKMENYLNNQRQAELLAKARRGQELAKTLRSSPPQRLREGLK